MNKGDLVAYISGETGMAKTDVEKVIDTLTEVITLSLKNGDKVMLVGFGTFSSYLRSERVARNPQVLNSKFVVKPKRVAKFKPGKDLIIAMLES